MAYRTQPNNILSVLLGAAGDTIQQVPGMLQDRANSQNQQKRFNLGLLLDQQNQARSQANIDRAFDYRQKQDEIAYKQRMLDKLLSPGTTPEQNFFYRYGDNLQNAPEGDLLQFAPNAWKKYYNPTEKTSNIPNNIQEYQFLVGQGIKPDVAMQYAFGGRTGGGLTLDSLINEAIKKKSGAKVKRESYVDGQMLPVENEEFISPNEAAAWGDTLRVKAGLAPQFPGISGLGAPPADSTGGKITIDQLDAIIKQLEQQYQNGR